MQITHACKRKVGHSVYVSYTFHAHKHIHTQKNKKQNKKIAKTKKEAK